MATKKTSTGLTDLLGALDAAFDVAQEKSAALIEANATQQQALAAAQAEFNGIKAAQQALVQIAADDAAKAQAELDRLRVEVNSRLESRTGKAANSRVEVR